MYYFCHVSYVRTSSILCHIFEYAWAHVSHLLNDFLSIRYVEYVEQHDKMKLEEHVREIEEQHESKLNEMRERTARENDKMNSLYEEQRKLSFNIETLRKEECEKRREYEDEIKK